MFKASPFVVMKAGQAIAGVAKHVGSDVSRRVRQEVEAASVEARRQIEAAVVDDAGLLLGVAVGFVAAICLAAAGTLGTGFALRQWLPAAAAWTLAPLAPGAVLGLVSWRLVATGRSQPLPPPDTTPPHLPGPDDHGRTHPPAR